MEERRRCTTARQMELLVDFMNGHRSFALGKVRSLEYRNLSGRFWREIAEKLNPEGPSRTGKEWTKVWHDLKCLVRTKIVAINTSLRATGGGPGNAPTLSPLEETVASIIGRDVGPLAGVRHNPFVSNNDNNDIVVEQPEQAQAAEVSPVILLDINDFDSQAEYDSPAMPRVMSSPIQVEVLRGSPGPSTTGHTLSVETSPRHATGRARRRREPRRLTQRDSRQPAPVQSAGNVLEESRLLMLRIEELRAEAALQIAEAFKLVADSIDRFSQIYFQQNNRTT